MEQKKSIYEEAIADAKAVRASAMANAKAQLEETFEPKIKELVKKMLEEGEDESMNTTYNKLNTLAKKVYGEFGFATLSEEEQKDLITKYCTLRFDAIKRDLKQWYNDSEGTDSEYPGYNVEIARLQKNNIYDVLNRLADTFHAEFGLATLDEEDQKNLINKYCVIKSSGKIMEEATEVDEAMEMEDETMDESMLDEILAELESEDESMDEAEDLQEAKEDEEAEESEDEEAEEVEDDTKIVDITLGDLVDAITAAMGEKAPEMEEAPEAEEMEAEEEISLDEILSEIEEAEEDTMEEAKMKHEKDEELEEAKNTIEELRTQLNEINLLNAKLLYMNKIFKNKTLSESQKVSVLKAFDRAESVKEVKSTYITLNESFEVKKTGLKESIGFASKTTNKVNSIVESDSFVTRMQQLAGIK